MTQEAAPRGRRDFVKYSFYKVSPEWRRLPEAQRSQSKIEFAEVERRLIVCISSKMGSMAENTSGGAYIYRSSKAALNAVVRSLAMDLNERGIAVVCFHPGWVATDMGGPEAPLEAPESVGGMRSVIERLTAADSGKFLNYDGSEVPW